MINKEVLLVLIFISVCLLFFCSGYLLGQNRSYDGVSNIRTPSKKTENNKPNSNISINDTKYVVDIKTTGLEKKYDKIGETKESSENITGSINKLKQLKG